MFFGVLGSSGPRSANASDAVLANPITVARKTMR